MSEFKKKAKCTSTGERIQPEYFNGIPYTRMFANFYRDAQDSKRLAREYREFKQLMSLARNP